MVICEKCLHIEACRQWYPQLPDKYHDGCESFASNVRCEDCKHKGWIQEPCHGKSIDYCHVWDSCIDNPTKCFCSYRKPKDESGNSKLTKQIIEDI